MDRDIFKGKNQFLRKCFYFSYWSIHRDRNTVAIFGRDVRFVQEIQRHRGMLWEEGQLNPINLNIMGLTERQDGMFNLKDLVGHMLEKNHISSTAEPFWFSTVC